MAKKKTILAIAVDVDLDAADRTDIQFIRGSKKEMVKLGELMCMLEKGEPSHYLLYENPKIAPAAKLIKEYEEILED